MSSALIIASEEWRYWLRSRLALSVVVLFVIILVSVSLLTALRMHNESAERGHHQNEAEQTFLSQPDRHPHRMVHYGHYIFRTPSPMALFDPGLDLVTGRSMFLEGHRQNSATFSESAASADLGGLSFLNPAMIYQIFAPLMIVLIGHSAVIRERETRALATLLAQGVGGGVLLAGKALALFLFIILLLVPLAVSATFSLSRGESALAVASLIGIYFLYLSIWAALTLFVSSWMHKRSAVIATLAAFWLAVTLVLPAIAVNVASRVAPLMGKIETELVMLTEARGLSDGHSVSHSDLEQLQSKLFEQYGVDRVEDLDVNIRGIVSQNAEKNLTETLNVYANKRMVSELRQANLVANHGWLTPTLAVAGASRALSGTDLEHYHHFLRQAESLRYEFVQGLNQVHVEQLAYTDDINRNQDEASYNRTRMDAGNWQLLGEFNFETASASDRLASAGMPIMMLVVWMTLLSSVLVWGAGRLKP